MDSPQPPHAAQRRPESARVSRRHSIQARKILFILPKSLLCFRPIWARNVKHVHWIFFFPSFFSLYAWLKLKCQLLYADDIWVEVKPCVRVDRARDDFSSQWNKWSAGSYGGVWRWTRIAVGGSDVGTGLEI